MSYLCAKMLFTFEVGEEVGMYSEGKCEMVSYAGLQLGPTDVAN